MIKVMVIFGTRPEAIKVAPVIKELQTRPETTPIVCVTGQHRQMLDQVLKAFDIVPDFDLNIMQQGQTLADITTRVLKGMEEVFTQVKPDIILVHGDTTTTFAASLAAFYHQIPIGHIEAGLRTYNKYAPYPEEMNRQMVSNLSDIHFAPTKETKENLIRENKKENSIIVTGNTAIDALKTTVIKDYKNDIIDELENKRIILLTAHRRENLGKPLENIFKAVKRIVAEYQDVVVIYPVHKNPQIRKKVEELFEGEDRIKLIEPLDVFDFHNFISKSYFILTDSGGIQEEAPAMGKPVLVLRDTTERPEGVEAGTLKLVGTNEENIYQRTKELLDSPQEYERMSKSANPYGDGNASKRIVDEIIKRNWEK
ncbi:MAG: UDP-N-acetylglucosamine 2-epimerase (non-hydrolyzing) [Clostridia bacterium]|nr:UDP-N-acetylglucosamine 2-epimerase (non-hydrolyzing) [Clostridia bacterium]